MKHLYCLICLVCSIAARAQPAKKDSTFRLRYDHSALRIPGKTFAVGLIVPEQGRKPTDTIGFPGNKSGWSKYRLTVDSGSFSSGKLKLNPSGQYKKGDSVTVNVYARKWLLGGKGKFLATRKIPYNYEDSLTVLTGGNAGRYPGDHIKFGVRTHYNNNSLTTNGSPAKRRAANDLSLPSTAVASRNQKAISRSTRTQPTSPVTVYSWWPCWQKTPPSGIP